MARPEEKLAESLEVLKELQNHGRVAIRASDLSRTHRERLARNGFLHEVMKGWYIPARSDETAGESTAWYASFWDFCATYLEERFGQDWSLSPEQSLLLHAGNRSVPRQLLVRAPKGGNKLTPLPHDTSLFDVRYTMPDKDEVTVMDGLRMYKLPPALVASVPRVFLKNPTNVRAALSMIKDASEVLALLLDGGHSTIAGRLAGAFRNIGRERIADDIVSTMKSAGYHVREDDPFQEKLTFALAVHEPSPYANRLRLMWHTTRDSVIETFPTPPGLPSSRASYLKAVEEIYVQDAYHSLSIEGYRVSRELIERVRSGSWNPDDDEEDRASRDAMAARGYWQAFQAVKQSVARVLAKENPGVVADEDHSTWYREMFGPSVTTGIVKAADLAGYRNGQVFIHRSMHTPPRHEAVRDCMPVFFDLLSEEQEVSVRVVLGHFVFVYIHPYIDGNGRMGRFLMNVMLASGGYPWTIVPVEERADYMAALEIASVEQNIRPFTKFLSRLVASGLKGKPKGKLPRSARASATRRA